MTGELSLSVGAEIANDKPGSAECPRSAGIQSADFTATSLA